MQISQKEKFVGWYTTGDSFKAHDIQINEIFRKVFTKSLDKDWVYFKLIESESDARYFSESARFKGKPFYEWNTLIFSDKIQNAAVLDLVV